MNRPAFSIPFGLALAAAAALTACAPRLTAAAEPPAALARAVEAARLQGDPALDAASLLDRLRADGFDVAAAGEIQQPFFSPVGQIVTVNGADVQVFEYAAIADALAEAAQIAPQGGAIGTTQVNWMAAPHFYSTGRLIVLYVGEDTRLLTELETVLDPQIAGR